MKSKGELIASFAMVAVFGGAMLGACGVQAAYTLSPDQNVRITVNDKESVQDGQNSKYLVFTENEVFQNEDALTRGKFNSSDVYNQLKEGCTYDARVFGFRFQPFSMYRNIVDVDFVPTPKCPTASGPK